VVFCAAKDYYLLNECLKRKLVRRHEQAAGPCMIKQCLDSIFVSIGPEVNGEIFPRGELTADGVRQSQVCPGQ
jgi:hypothetical protein